MKKKKKTNSNILQQPKYDLRRNGIDRRDFD